MIRVERACRGILALFAAVWLLQPATARAQAFDFDNGNAPTDVIIPAAVPLLLSQYAPGDATLILRATTMMTNAWFDAIAPYHETAVGVYSRIPRRPPGEGVTNRNENVAIFYATARVGESLFPQFGPLFRDMIASVGLDPDDTHEDDVTPSGIGNKAGNAVARARERDGMNQLGDEGGRAYNRQPYADYLGYAPVNTPYALRDPERWQPNIVTAGNGIFRTQQFVTPQMRVTKPYSYGSPGEFTVPAPSSSMYKGRKQREAYKRQADEVLAASAALTDYQKMSAELFDNKLATLGFVAFFVTQTRGLSLDEFVQYDFMVNVAAFDGAIATWNQKFEHDAVRPFSAIRFLYEDQLVTAWGGPGKGTRDDVLGQEWRSYMETADHPEYPSGSACFCAAHSQASRRYLGSDALGWAVPAPAGSSRVEPGVTPAADIVLGPWATWTDFENECGLSRFWGGVHFLSAVTEGKKLCRPIGDTAFEFVQRHIEGIVD